MNTISFIRNRFPYLQMSIIVLSVILLCFSVQLWADSDTEELPAVNIPTVYNLQTLGESAKQQQLPIILVYSASDCEHCERLEENVLAPLLLSGDLNNLAIIRKIMIDSVESVTDFNGKTRDAENYSIVRDVEVTPTIEFVDSNGTALVSPIVGYQSEDMYIAYLLAAAEASRLIVNSQTR